MQRRKSHIPKKAGAKNTEANRHDQTSFDSVSATMHGKYGAYYGNCNDAKEGSNADGKHTSRRCLRGNKQKNVEANRHDKTDLMSCYLVCK